MEKTKEKGKFTGKHMLISILSFFGVIFAMNFTMAYIAFDTFSGLESNNAYHEGRLFNRELAAADRQTQDNWQMNLQYKLSGNDKILVHVESRDKTGAPLTGLDVRIRLRRPTQAHMDQKVVLKSTGVGIYQGVVPLPQKGQWDLILLAYKQKKERYKSVKRIVLK